MITIFTFFVGSQKFQLQFSNIIPYKKLELVEHITLYTNGEPHLKQNSSNSLFPQFCNDSACCLVCNFLKTSCYICYTKVANRFPMTTGTRSHLLRLGLALAVICW